MSKPCLLQVEVTTHKSLQEAIRIIYQLNSIHIDLTPNIDSRTYCHTDHEICWKAMIWYPME